MKRPSARRHSLACYPKGVALRFRRVVPAAFVVVACTETPSSVPPCNQPDAACVPYTMVIDAGTTPAKHRPSSSPCPSLRGPGALTAACDYDAGPAVPCLHDSDCTAGINGRCLPAPPVACDTACSYDQCQQDSDCGHVPCNCRGSATDSAANVCLVGSDCQVDTDCGSGGYCSPSGMAGSCSIAYFCHTPGDKCMDDSDCPDAEGCNFDPSVSFWSCSPACAQPP